MPLTLSVWVPEIVSANCESKKSNVWIVLTMTRLAHTEARLVLTKLLWHFDIELDGLHEGWIEAARFFVLWELKPLLVRVTPAKRS